jgi:dienelactone hydrolase
LYAAKLLPAKPQHDKGQKRILRLNYPLITKSISIVADSNGACGKITEKKIRTRGGCIKWQNTLHLKVFIVSTMRRGGVKLGFMKADSRLCAKNTIIFMGFAVALLLSGCVALSGQETRANQAQIIAAQAHLAQRVINTGSFDITAFAKITDPAQPVSVYIEGDGKAWLSRHQPSTDPTPTDPVGLRLAAVDGGDNVVYLARPCQYSRGTACETGYWTTKRFAPEALRAMNAALDEVLRDMPERKIRLVGFSGGGTMAALMAARRKDVVDLRSVAGNLDHRAQSALHRVSLLSGSLNPVDDAAILRAVPQHHFIGGKDRTVPFEIYQSYAAALGDISCTAHTIFPAVSHEDGWVEKWREAQYVRPVCRGGP